MTMADDESTISFPSIAVVAVLGYIIYRYFWSSSSTASPSSSSARNGLRFTPAQVDQISAMFPQLSRRDIMWDLHRNRGSVQATTERVLMGRGLDPAPPSFQPPVTFSTPSTNAAVTGRSSRATTHHADLITRYNLQSRVSGSDKGKEKEQTKESNTTGWATTKDARQQMLQRRRDEMILAARRKMMEKEEQSSVGASTTGHVGSGPALSSG